MYRQFFFGLEMSSPLSLWYIIETTIFMSLVDHEERKKQLKGLERRAHYLYV
jgi:hypothetical protein